ncbi:MAG: VanZ family protein [Clostridia bacterium]|jgi:VanZ family protein|nr:VanZ family protein [Clostridia bacterium]
MNKDKLIKIFKIALILMWIIVVFMFSNETGKESRSTSRKVTETIVQKLSNKSIEENKKIVEKVDRIVRKTAHFTIYAIGGFLIISYAYKKDKKKKVLLICIAFGACYAITDELHQFFVSERSASPFDVAIDTMGVITGIVIYLIIKKIESHVKKGT